MGSVEPKPLLIRDTHADLTFQLHRATAVSPKVRSFLGVPIVLNSGEVYGTLCAIDPEAQDLTMQQADFMVVLGRIIATQIERDREVAIRAQAEAEQARLRQAAQDAVREREALLSIASHELKNPLTALMGFANLLHRRLVHETSLPERDKHAAQMIVTQAERLNRMLSDLLDVSRLESGQFTLERFPLDLATLAHTVVEEVQPTLTNHTITVEDGDRPIMVHGDAERLAQVLRNLVGNAIRYSPRGGQVRVVVEAADGQARVAVHDKGIGIPEEALPKLFRRFYRAPNAGAHAIDGFGIGLFVVKEIVTLHDGTIHVSSTEGEGTTFTISLPLRASSSL